MGRNILLIGIGETGCSVAENFSRNPGNGIHAVALAADTDKRTLADVFSASAVPMHSDSLLNSVIDSIGAENVREWFPCDWDEDRSGFLKGLEMNKGANMWRLKALLAFAVFLNDTSATEQLKEKVEKFVGECGYPSNIEIYTVASLAGGTGGALYMPLTLYVKGLVKKAGGDVDETAAFLTCPDIYETVFSKEQRVKSYSNAYAALRELHAVNLVSRGYGRECADGKHAPVAFKIDIKGENFNETLYDSDAESFGNVDAAPFDKVYLFERVAGITSVDEHVGIVADALRSLCADEENGAENKQNNSLKTSDDIYGAVALTKAGYPVDDIVNYIAKRKLFDDADGEWLKLYRRTMKEMRRRRGEARAYGYHFPEDSSDFSEVLVGAAEELIAEKGSELGMLGRVANEATLSSLPGELLTIDCIAQLEKIFDEKCFDDAENKIEELCEGITAKMDKKAKSSIFDGSKRKAKMVEAAKKYNNILSDAYADTMVYVEEKMGELKDQLLSSSGDGSYSFVDSLVKKDGKFLHPVYAAARICLAYKTVNAKISKKDVIDDCDLSYYGGSIPNELFAVSDNVSYKSKYTKCGEDRLIKLIDDRHAPTNGSEHDAAQFAEDMTAVSGRVFTILRSNLYERVLSILSILVERYRGFFEMIDRIVDELESDLKTEILINSSDCGLAVNIASTPEDKVHAYKSYIEFNAHNGDSFTAADEALGAKVANLVLGEKKEITRADVRETVKLVSRDYVDFARKGDFFALHLDKNILEVLLDPDDLAVADTSHAAKALRLSRTFIGRSAPLRLTMSEDATEFRKASVRTSVLLPEAVRVYAEKMTGTNEPATLIEPLLSKVGEGSGRVTYSAAVPEKFIYIRRDLSGVQLHFIEALNERGDAPVGYSNYLRSFGLMKAQTTQMWNPHVFRCQGDGYCRLPYISPGAQREYDKQIAKALLYASLYNEIFASEIENVDGKVLCYMDKDVVTPIFLGNDAIAPGETEKLFAWLAASPEVSERWARVYDRIAEDDRRSLKDTGSGTAGVSRLSQQMSALPSLRVLKEKLLPLVDFYRRERNCAALAEKLLAVGYETFRTFCSYRYKVDDLDFIDLYDRQLDEFMECFAKSKSIADLDDFKEFVSWVNSCGAFCLCKPMNKTSNYEITPEFAEYLK